MTNKITCNNCGRSFKTAGDGCNFNNNCIQEYSCTMPACIRNKQPDCTAAAVIPSITVDTIDGITNLANCFVHVNNINTTFYVDDKHRIMITWAGNVETTLPADVTTDVELVAFVKSFGLRSQFLYVTFKTSDTPARNLVKAFYFDKTGKAYAAGEFEELVEEVL